MIYEMVYVLMERKKTENENLILPIWFILLL